MKVWMFLLSLAGTTLPILVSAWGPAQDSGRLGKALKEEPIGPGDTAVEQAAASGLDVDQLEGDLDNWLRHPGLTDEQRLNLSRALGVPLPPDEPLPPAADFSGEPLVGEAPLVVVFVDESTGTVDSHLWAFGDGAGSMQDDPTHTYVDPGVYAVGLTVAGPGGEDVVTKVDYVTVTEPHVELPTPWFQLKGQGVYLSTALNNAMHQAGDPPVEGAVLHAQPFLVDGYMMGGEITWRTTVRARWESAE